MLLEINNLWKNLGGVQAIQDFNLNVEKGEILGIIGPNGAGKTTIFNVISGVYTASDGAVVLDGQNITKLPQHEITRLGIGRTFQNIRLFKGLSIVENVMCAFDPKSKYGFTNSILPLPKRYSEEKRGKELCKHYLEIVGLGGYMDEAPENLAYGYQRRLEIARALMCNPKVLLLDEPAAGLNPTEVSELRELILKLSEEFGFAIMLIEHRLELVMGISHRIVVQNFGKTIAIDTPGIIKDDPEVIKAYLGAEEEEDA